MMKLNDRAWKAFEVDQLFSEIKIALSSDSNHLKKGNTPFVGRSYNYNGYQGLYDIEKFKINEAGLITLSMVGTLVSFVQPFEFACSQNILLLKCNNNNFYAKLFIVTTINKLLKDGGYGYGHPMSLFRFKRKKVKLPITSNASPDYNFMEQYIKEKYFNLKSQIKEKQKHEITDWRELSEIEWSIFEMDNIFKFKQGKSKGLNHLKIGGRVPYLGAKYNNNGVLAFVQNNSNFITKGNCISFIRNGEGSMGYSIYKHEDHIATSDITNGYNNHLNKYNGQFISTMSNLVRGKYNFGYKRSLTRLKKEQIKLPTFNKQPDYDFMEQYMKRKENEVLDRL